MAWRKTFLTGDLESAVFWKARGRSHNSPQIKIDLQKVAIRRHPQNYHHDVFLQHEAGDIKCVWVCFILLQLSSLPWYFFFKLKGLSGDVPKKMILWSCHKCRTETGGPYSAVNHFWNGCWAAHKDVQGIFHYSSIFQAGKFRTFSLPMSYSLSLTHMHADKSYLEHTWIWVQINE